MRDQRFLTVSIVFFTLAVMLTSCLGPGTRQETKFYVLSSLYSQNKQPRALANLPDLAVGVGPVKIPLHLDRPEIVTRASENEIQRADFAQWAGPLRESITRVLAENLSILLATDRVASFPWGSSISIDYRVIVDLTRFDGVPGEDAILRARWSILDKKGKKVLFEKVSMLKEPTGNDTMEALIAAKSRTLADMSREMAEAIKALAEGQTPQQ